MLLNLYDTLYERKLLIHAVGNLNRSFVTFFLIKTHPSADSNKADCILSIPLSPFSLPISKYYQRCLYPVGIYKRWPYNSNLWNERMDLDKSTMILYGIKYPALNVVLSSSHIITWCTWLQVYSNPIMGLIPPMELYRDGANMYHMVCGQTLLIPLCRLSLRELLVFCLAFITPSV